MKLILIALILVSIRVDADELNEAIYHASLKYNVNAEDLLRISFVESSLRIHVGDRYNANGTYDSGPFQINSPHRLTTCKDLNVDLVAHNAECAARLVAMHKKKSKVDLMWLARYHSKTPSKKRGYYRKLQKASAHIEKRVDQIISMND